MRLVLAWGRISISPRIAQHKGKKGQDKQTNLSSRSHRMQNVRDDSGNQSDKGFSHANLKRFVSVEAERCRLQIHKVRVRSG
jgi:hypothetical protein